MNANYHSILYLFIYPCNCCDPCVNILDFLGQMCVRPCVLGHTV